MSPRVHHAVFNSWLSINNIYHNRYISWHVYCMRHTHYSDDDRWQCQHLHRYRAVAMTLPDGVLGYWEAEIGRRSRSILHHRHRHVHVVPGRRYHQHGGGRHGNQPGSRWPTLDGSARRRRRRDTGTDHRHLISRCADSFRRGRRNCRTTTCRNGNRLAGRAADVA